MRCPHCAGEIPAGSRFCGICGRSITPALVGPHAPAEQHAYAPPPSGPSAVDTVSLFELPASRAARRRRLALVLVLDAILAGAGVVMLLAYFESRRDGALAPALPGRAAGEGDSAAARSPGEAPEAVKGAGQAPDPGWAAEPDPSPSSVPASKAPVRPAKPRTAPAPGGQPKPKPKGGSSARTGEPPDVVPAWQPVPDTDAVLATVAAVDRPASGDVVDTDIELLTSRLRRVVDRHQAELEDCYLGGSNSGGPDDLPEGRIDIRFTLMPRGSAAHVTPVRNTTGSAELAECVADRIRSWRLPGGLSAPIELEWPFLFHPPQRDAPP